jgi:hypothetical protein
MPGLIPNPQTYICEPIPGCGGDGQPPCGGDTCNAGYTVNPVVTNNVCVPCGDVGEYACETVGVGFACNTGNPTDEGNVVCVACGQNGESPCEKGAACDSGTVLSTSGAAECVSCGELNAAPGPGGCCPGGVEAIADSPGTAQLCVAACGSIGQLPCVNGGCTQFDAVVNAGSSQCNWPTNCGSAGQGCCNGGNAFQGPNGTGLYNQTGATQDTCHDGSECSWGPGASNLFDWQWWCYNPTSSNNGNAFSCPNGAGQGSYSVCVTCQEADPFTQQVLTCSMADAVANTVSEYKDQCQVVANACNGD